jgi:hypothetical protein
MKKWYSVILNLISFFLLLMAIIHMAFWEIFDWKVTLACLNEENRNAMYTLDIIVIFFFILMALITAFYKKELVNSGLGRFILVLFSSVAFLRVILEFIIWSPPDLLMIIPSLFIGIAYSLPLWIRRLVWTE